MECGDFKQSCCAIFFIRSKCTTQNPKIALQFSVSEKIKKTHLVNIKISIGNSELCYDLFISKEKQGIMINEHFHDLSKGNTLFLRETKKGKFKTKQM